MPERPCECGCGEVVWVDDEDDYYNDDDYNSRGLDNLMHSYEYRPEPQFFQTVKEYDLEKRSNKVFLGLELEIGMRYDTYNEPSSELMDIFTCPWLYLKHDSSISENNDDYRYGVEIVTHPFSQAWYIKMTKWWDEALRVMRSNHCISGEEVNAGIHIHIGRDGFETTKHLYRFLRLFYEDKKFTLWLSNRESHLLRHYATVDDKLVKIARKVVNDSKQIKDGNRRVAVNLEPDHTVEVRIFRGTLNLLFFHSNIQAIFAAIEFTREELTKNINARNFLAWVTERSEQYPHLTKRMNLWSTNKA